MRMSIWIPDKFYVRFSNGVIITPLWRMLAFKNRTIYVQILNGLVNLDCHCIFRLKTRPLLSTSSRNKKVGHLHWLASTGLARTGDELAGFRYESTELSPRSLSNVLRCWSRSWSRWRARNWLALRWSARNWSSKEKSRKFNLLLNPRNAMSGTTAARSRSRF